MFTGKLLSAAVETSTGRTTNPRLWARSVPTDGPGIRAFSGLRSPFIPLVLVAVQQILHRSGANQWLSFPFHLLALAWLVLVVTSARGIITRAGGWLAIAGGALNGLVVAATKGMMPVDIKVWERVYGGPLINKQRMHTIVMDGWRHFFGDRFGVASLGMVVSAGDILLVGGAGIALLGFLWVRIRQRRQSFRSPT